MKASRVMKWVTGAMEAFLGIPFIGGAFVLGLYWTPLFVMFILHIITLVLSSRDNNAKAGSILGIITSLVAWIPFVGMFMHIASAIVLMITAAKKDDNHQNYSNSYGA
jgi:predicted branched-subunit amino acid permease